MCSRPSAVDVDARAGGLRSRDGADPPDGDDAEAEAKELLVLHEREVLELRDAEDFEEWCDFAVEAVCEHEVVVLLSRHGREVRSYPLRGILSDFWSATRGALHAAGSVEGVSPRERQGAGVGERQRAESAGGATER